MISLKLDGISLRARRADICRKVLIWQRSSHRRYSIKKVFLKILQNSRENNRVSKFQLEKDSGMGVSRLVYSQLVDLLENLYPTVLV